MISHTQTVLCAYKIARNIVLCDTNSDRTRAGLQRQTTVSVLVPTLMVVMILNNEQEYYKLLMSIFIVRVRMFQVLHVRSCPTYLDVSSLFHLPFFFSVSTHAALNGGIQQRYQQNCSINFGNYEDNLCFKVLFYQVIQIKVLMHRKLLTYLISFSKQCFDN